VPGDGITKQPNVWSVLTFSTYRGYIVFGIATVVIGVLVFFFLPDDPHHRLLHLTEKEKEIVEERSRDNCVVRVLTIKKEQMWEAIKEPRLWLFMLANTLSSLQNGGLVTFSTLLVEGLGFSVSNEKERIV
jgi:sugar phosphate permease